MNSMTASAIDHHFEIRECLVEDCRLRIPVVGDELPGGRCPRCGGEMQVADGGTLGVDRQVPWTAELRCSVHVLLDNVRSTFNVGAIMRVADGAGVKCVHMCGITPTPEHRKVAKTALGAESTVAWIYHRNAIDAAVSLRADGFELWAIENPSNSSSLFDSELPKDDTSVALIVGNEISGVDSGLLKLSSRILHLPMNGIKGSLNVAVTFGIAVYWLRGQAETPRVGSGTHRCNNTSATSLYT